MSFFGSPVAATAYGAAATAASVTTATTATTSAPQNKKAPLPLPLVPYWELLRDIATMLFVGFYHTAEPWAQLSSKGSVWPDCLPAEASISDGSQQIHVRT